jgi:hypothetical protein
MLRQIGVILIVAKAFSPATREGGGILSMWLDIGVQHELFMAI